MTEETKAEMEESKGNDFDGLPQIEETKGNPIKKKVLHDDSDDDDSFVHCDPNIGVGEEDMANLTGQLP